jgi:alkanesulfonate monooxygenase SsuD/methylene tetrahydromethanopterin reductase-like flavin-dependent oxidoreductase (luciferase family)
MSVGVGVGVGVGVASATGRSVGCRTAVRSFRPTLAPPGRLVRLGVVLDERNPPDRVRLLAQMCERAGIDALWASNRSVLILAAEVTTRPRLGLLVASPPGGLDTSRLELSLPDPPTGVWADVHLAIEANDAAALELAVQLAHDVVLPAAASRAIEAAVAEVRAACARLGRDPATLGIALQLPVSVGRTAAEAFARAAAEPLFQSIGQPAEVGLFGTLEECQDRVIALAHAGVTDLRCVLPNSPDVPDVIAQLTAMVVGTVDVLAPGAPRSKAPDPPVGWGGRRRRS